jgi:two-component system response regulator MprA
MARILVIEDDGPIATVLERGLRLAGHDVVVEVDSREGRRRWAEGEADAIVLDLMLPGANGLELCAERRRSGDRTPVLLLTARDEEGVRRQARLAGASAVMTKPFVYADLVEWVRRAVGERPEPVTRPTDRLDV